MRPGPGSESGASDPCPGGKQQSWQLPVPKGRNQEGKIKPQTEGGAQGWDLGALGVPVGLGTWGQSRDPEPTICSCWEMHGADGGNTVSGGRLPPRASSPPVPLGTHWWVQVAGSWGAPPLGQHQRARPHITRLLQHGADPQPPAPLVPRAQVCPPLPPAAPAWGHGTSLVAIP